MHQPNIDLAWWPPDPAGPIGWARAYELFVTLRLIAGPVVEEAVLNLQAKVNPSTEIVRSCAPAGEIVTRINRHGERMTLDYPM